MTGPTAVKCQVALEGLQQAVDAAGGSAELTVRTQPECAWTASAEAGWISSLSPVAGQGDGRIQIQVPANPIASTRQGDIVVNGSRAAVRQAAAPCRYEVTPRELSIESGPGTGSASVVATTGCSWSAASSVDWIQVAAGSSASGSGRVSFSVAANPGPARTGALTIASESLMVTQLAASADPGDPCSVDLTPTNQFIPVGGSASNRIAVAIAPGCQWSATSSVPWIAIIAGATGQGAGAVEFSVAANTGLSRTATLSVAGRPFNVTQAGSTPCTYNITPTSQTLPAAGGSGTPITVTAASGCAWAASSNASWLTITSGSTGTGSGTVNFSASANTGAERTATLTIAGTTFTVVQGAGAPAPEPPPTQPPPPPVLPPGPTPTPTPPPGPTPAPCAYAISSASQSVGSLGGPGNPVGVSTTAACSWTAASNANWISITSGSSGVGNGSVAFTVDINLGAQRSGTLTVAGETVTVTQAAVVVPCSYQLSPTQQSIGSAGGSGSTVVTTATGCAWTAASNDSWITVTSGALGVGGGTVAFTIASNSGAARNGSLTVAGQTFAVQQAAFTPPCSYSIGTSSQSIGSAGGNGSAVAVTAAAGCAWTASSNAAWLTITSGASGAGNGSVGFSVAANTGAQRVGTLTIAGHTFTVTQAAAPVTCSYSINPTSDSVLLLGGPGRPVAVTAGAGCNWTATSNVPWITVTSGASGSGNGTVEYVVSLLLLGSRTGTLTIAGQTFTVTQSGALP